MSDFDVSEARSVSPEDKETVYENDRLYQKVSLERRIYCVPIDDEEEERLETQHNIISLLFDGKLFLSDVEDPRRVLDCGYGQALWILAVAQEYEGCQVVGIDIFPRDLSVPEESGARLDITLEFHDLNQNLTETFRPASFDVIQSRIVAPGIHKNRWRSYVLELSRLLKPGGALQMIEYYYNIQSSSGMIGSGSALFEWGEKYRAAMSTDRDPRIGSSDPRFGGRSRLQQLMEEAGLAQVQQQCKNVPIGGWPTDPRQRRIGLDNLANIDSALDSLGIWPFTNRLGMTRDDVQALNERARQELRDPRIKAYIPLTAVWGKRVVGT